MAEKKSKPVLINEAIMSKAMTKEEFRKRWESDENGGGITYNDCAQCAIAWGITDRPFTYAIDTIVKAVCKAAGIKE